MRKDLEDELRSSTKRLRSARKKADQAWVDHQEVIRRCIASETASYGEVAKISGVTKGRVWQIVKRSS